MGETFHYKYCILKKLKDVGRRDGRKTVILRNNSKGLFGTKNALKRGGKVILPEMIK